MDRLTVPEAAARLGLSENAMRKRIQRGTIEHDKDEEGRVFVYLSPDVPPTMTGQADGMATDQAADQSRLVQSMQDQIDYLRGVLKTRDQELAEMRRLLAGALERIPALEESPRDAPGGDISPSEDRGKGDVPPEQEKPVPWWRRVFGLPRDQGPWQSR